MRYKAGDTVYIKNGFLGNHFVEINAIGEDFYIVNCEIYKNSVKVATDDDIDIEISDTLNKCSDFELKLMQKIEHKYKWIAKDKDGLVYAFQSKPEKGIGRWIDSKNVWAPVSKGYINLFPSILWSDEAPTYIVRL